MVSDHSTIFLVFHIVMISEGTEVRQCLNADFSYTKFIATAVAICPHCLNERRVQGRFVANQFKQMQLHLQSLLSIKQTVLSSQRTGAPNGNFRENICSEDDLRTRIFGTFVVKFLAYLLLRSYFRTSIKWYNCPFLTDFHPKKVT